MMPSPEIDVCLCLFAGAKRKEHVGEDLFQLSLLEFMHLPTNPEHKLLHFPHNKCDVTRLSAIPNSRCLVAVAPFLPLPFFLHTDRPKTLVYRDLISRHTLVVTSQITNKPGERGLPYVDPKTVCFCQVVNGMASNVLLL